MKRLQTGWYGVTLGRRRDCRFLDSRSPFQPVSFLVVDFRLYLFQSENRLNIVATAKTTMNIFICIFLSKHFGSFLIVKPLIGNKVTLF